MSQTILLALDERTDADADPVTTAIARASDESARLHVLYVVDTSRYGEPALSSVEAVVDQHEDDGHRLLGKVAARANARGVDVETQCRHGTPNETLLAVARDVDADAVVVGRRIPHAIRDRLDEETGAVLTRLPGRVSA